MTTEETITETIIRDGVVGEEHSSSNVETGEATGTWVRNGNTLIITSFDGETIVLKKK